MMPKIDGEPDYEHINTMMQLLYGNTASLSTALGGGKHRHIGIIMTLQLYTTLANTPYVNRITMIGEIGRAS